MQTYDFGHKTLREVVERINYGPIAGFAHLTPEYLAASYAVEAALDDLEPALIDADFLQFHFDVLVVSGAEFDEASAAAMAMQMLEAK